MTSRPLTVALAHPFREQLLTFLADKSRYQLLKGENRTVSNNQTWSGEAFSSFEAYRNAWRDSAVPFLTRLQRRFGLINIRWFHSDADLVLANGGFLLTNRPYIAYIEKATQLFGYAARNHRSWLARFLIRNRLEDSNLRTVVFRTETALNGFRATFADDAQIRRLIDEKGTWAYPVVQATPTRKTSRKVTFFFSSSSFILKGGEQLVDAFNRLSKERSDIKLIIVTKRTTIRPQYLERIKRNSAILLIEANLSLEESRRLLAKSDCLVYPTYSDSFSMVVNEAIVNGLPVISTDFFSIPERVYHGVNGLLVKTPFPNYTRSFVITAEHFTDDCIIDRIVTAADNGTLIPIERFLYNALKRFSTDASFRRRLTQGALAMNLQRVGHEVQQKRWDFLISDALTTR
jgi:glycosyltransferase involved in cell wall biosynthesis